MTQNTINVQGGQRYESPAVEVVNIEIEQPVFQMSTGNAEGFGYDDYNSL